MITTLTFTRYKDIEGTVIRAVKIKSVSRWSGPDYVLLSFENEDTPDVLKGMGEMPRPGDYLACKETNIPPDKSDFFIIHKDDFIKKGFKEIPKSLDPELDNIFNKYNYISEHETLQNKKHTNLEKYLPKNGIYAFQITKMELVLGLNCEEVALYSEGNVFENHVSLTFCEENNVTVGGYYMRTGRESRAYLCEKDFLELYEKANN